ncbi:MAG: CD1247 N-terminal domain-containing protein [Bacillota bacterium]
MKKLHKKVAYIHGMVECLDLDKKEPVAKLVLQMIDLLDELVDELDDLKDRVEENEDFLEALDADLADVEDAVFEDDEECSCHCEDPEEFEIQCPHCDAFLTVDEDELAEAAEDELIIHCPECGEIIFSEEDGEEVVITEDEDSE